MNNWGGAYRAVRLNLPGQPAGVAVDRIELPIIRTKEDMIVIDVRGGKDNIKKYID